MIPVTRPFLPPFSEVAPAIEEVWKSGWITNHGPKVQALEAALQGVAGMGGCYLANGTLALQLGIRALGLRGKVITTPFSFVATTSALVWEGCTPVFVDIDPKTFNLDPVALDTVNLEGVSGILATHVFGVPCDHHAIGAFAERNGLKVLYDAAHCFGTRVDDRSALALGDASATSFHATKLFHTVEGGAVFSPDDELLERVRSLRSFGERKKGEYAEPGINAKSGELNAAVGLVMLPHVAAILERRRSQWTRYHEQLSDVLAFQHVPEGVDYNHAYVPVLFPTETALLEGMHRLHAMDVHPRRYFHPSLSGLPWVESGPTPIADDVASRILCLPLYHELEDADIDAICAALRTQLGSA